MRKLFRSLCAAYFLAVSPPVAAEPVQLFSIGSGDVLGNYYPVAKAICEAFNAYDDTRRRCSPEPTAGSIYNLTALRENEVEFAIVQSDWQKAALDGTGPFRNKPAMADLRAVMSLFSEKLTILASPGSDIQSAGDLQGKVVDIGRPSSGRNATIRSLLNKLSLSTDYFGRVRELLPNSAIAQLCDGSIDAAIIVVGHPSELVRRALERCDIEIAAFDGPLLRAFVEQSSDYQRDLIDLSIYGIPGERVHSASVKATLVTRASTDEALVRDLAAAIRAAAPKLAEDVAVLNDLPSYINGTDGLNIPRHPVLETTN